MSNARKGRVTLCAAGKQVSTTDEARTHLPEDAALWLGLKRDA